MAGGSYDEKDTVSAVKKARAGEQQQLNIERIKAEIAAENEKMAEENKENLTKISSDNVQANLAEEVEDIEEFEDAEINEELNEIEENIDDNDEKDAQIEEENENIDNLEDNEAPIDSAEIENNDSSDNEKQEVHEEKNVEPEDNPSQNSKYSLVITTENLPFSKMKSLMTIISWNPWDIDIQVLWNEMKVSEKWLNELKKLILE